MPKLSVAILYGGRSVEHGVSINSARNIFQFIDRSKFNPVPIGVTQEGKWYLTPTVDKNIRRGVPVVFRLDPTKSPFVADGKPVRAHAVFPVLHGTDGEDGSVQGLLKTMNIPTIGTGVLGSALSMNKIAAKQMLKAAGVPVTDFIALRRKDDAIPSFEKVKNTLGLPFMVKSASLGSSVGVTKVNGAADYKKAVAEAFRYDHELLFERYVKGREIECAILGNDPPKASRPGEIVISKNYEFYTFDAKYVDDKAVTIKVPADLPSAIADKIMELSVKAFEILHCEDYARVDLFLADSGEVFVNEINTIPGFTNSSMYPMMWKDRGISFTELITRLINLAMERHADLGVQHEFKSSLKY
ncbi:MAG: D-alanine--D-alanine ligase [Bacteroidetes bacterium]|nr:D-alanine--D-alanine ligase [Bacteroidota bacterium]